MNGGQTLQLYGLALAVLFGLLALSMVADRAVRDEGCAVHRQARRDGLDVALALVLIGSGVIAEVAAGTPVGSWPRQMSWTLILVCVPTVAALCVRLGGRRRSPGRTA